MSTPSYRVFHRLSTCIPSSARIFDWWSEASPSSSWYFIVLSVQRLSGPSAGVIRHWVKHAVERDLLGVWSQRKVIGRQDRSLVCPTIGLYAFAWILLSACKLRGFVEEQITRRGGLPAGRRSLRASLGIPRLMRRAFEIMRRKTIARRVGNPHTRKVAIHHRAFLFA